MPAAEFKTGDKVRLNIWGLKDLGVGEIIGVHPRRGYAVLWETETLDDVREGWIDGDLRPAGERK